MRTRSDGSGFQPSIILRPSSQAVGLGWYGNGPLALNFSANGAPPYQPGATPQVPDPKPIKG